MKAAARLVKLLLGTSPYRRTRSQGKLNKPYPVAPGPLRSASLRLSVFYAAIFLAGGIQLPFWPVWLAARHLTAAEIGVLMAAGQWAKVAANPFIGMVADRSADRRRVMAALGLACVLGYLLCLPERGVPALIMLTAASAACSAALLPLGDTLALAVSTSEGLDYGRMRLWGTIAFIAATLLGGRILGGRSPEIILHLVLAATALTAAACFFLPRVTAQRRPQRWWAAGRRLLTRRHLLFLGAATLVQASHSVYYVFGTLHWQGLGFSSETIAWLWAEGALAEIVLFFWGAPLVRRLGPTRLIALGGLAGGLRWTATAVTGALPVLAAVQLLHAFTFGAAHLGAMHYLSRSLPPEHAATGQALYAASVSGLGFGLVTVAAGALYAAVGGGAYVAMAAIALAGALAAAFIDGPAAWVPATKS